MVQKLKKLWKNPLVRRLAFWIGPILIGWVLSKFDTEKAPSKSSKRK